MNKYLPVKAGFIFRPGSLWVGAHYASYNKRLCLNLLPMVTLWMIWEGGNEPR